MEAIVDQSLWIWHTFFGLLCENRDINALNQWPMVTSMLYGVSSDMRFEVNNNVYPWYYYILANGIYTPLCKPYMNFKKKKMKFFFSWDLTMVKRRGSKFFPLVNLHGNNIHWAPITNLCNSTMEPYIVHQVVWCPMQNFTRPHNKIAFFINGRVVFSRHPPPSKQDFLF